MKPRFMPCADEDMQVRRFEPNGDEVGGRLDYTCMTCGWSQTSSAAGAAELCNSATWHDLAAFEQYERIARSAGHEVISFPRMY